MNATSLPFSVFVNSSDGFTDCWHPFFTLFARYWPACQAPLYLNTETKDYQHPGMTIVSTKIQGASSERLPWSECLLRGLGQVQTPLVLYFQEDYFLHQPVLHERVLAAAEFMMKHPEVGHVGLTRHGSVGPFRPHEEDGLQVIGPKAKYRISTQAGLWRTEVLNSYLVPQENGWMFEIYGTWRSHRRNDCFLVAAFDREHGGPAIDYLHTGIIKGRWLKEIQPVFERHGIDIDYARRGFYEPKPAVLRKLETGMRLLQDPRYLLKQLL